VISPPRRTRRVRLEILSEQFASTKLAFMVDTVIGAGRPFKQKSEVCFGWRGEFQIPADFARFVVYNLLPQI
jgi:hypothetical protein